MDAVGVPGYAWDELFPQERDMYNAARERFKKRISKAKSLHDLGVAFRSWINETGILKKIHSAFLK
jgi:hypothetical protein